MRSKARRTQRSKSMTSYSASSMQLRAAATAARLAWWTAVDAGARVASASMPSPIGYQHGRAPVGCRAIARCSQAKSGSKPRSVGQALARALAATARALARAPSGPGTGAQPRLRAMMARKVACALEASAPKSARTCKARREAATSSPAATRVTAAMRAVPRGGGHSRAAVTACHAWGAAGSLSRSRTSALASAGRLVARVMRSLAARCWSSGSGDCARLAIAAKARSITGSLAFLMSSLATRKRPKSLAKAPAKTASNTPG
jgi:hypothetical protein